MVDRFLVWLSAGMVTAGVSAAMVVGVGIAAAETGSPGSDGKGTTSAESTKPTENKADSDKGDAGTPKPKPAANIVDGDMVRIASPHGQIELPVIVTKNMVAGVLAVPHGWGHKGTGGWRLANGARAVPTSTG
jgi:hypothetical protein